MSEALTAMWVRAAFLLTVARLVRPRYPRDRLPNRTSNATRHMQEINAAYEVLKNPTKRAQYDRDLSFQTSQSDAKYAEERRRREEAGYRQEMQQRYQIWGEITGMRVAV